MTLSSICQVLSLRFLDVVFVAAGFLLVKSFITKLVKHKSSQGYKLLPGPTPLPLIGNYFDLPKDRDWIHWAKYKDIYGPIVSVSVFGQRLVILNDMQAAFDLLDKRSNIYSDRPVLTFASELCGWKDTLALLQYGERCRAYRRLIFQLLGTYKAVERYHELITSETCSFLRQVQRVPDNIAEHVRFLPGSITLRMLYGYRATELESDPLVGLAEKAIAQFSDATMPGKWVVDALPFLKYLPIWFPGCTFKTLAQEYKRTFLEFINRPLSFVKYEMASGNAPSSYTADLLALEKLDKQQEFDIKYSAASLYAAGTDTTVSTVHTFFLAMMLYPDVQKIAQEEIDSVVGSNRLPRIEDRRNLSYVNAIVKEASRWNPVLPLGFPHIASKDDVYEGYFIPKGTTIVPNVWLFTHDSANYHDPMEFIPGRYLKSPENPTPERDPTDVAFGFGRRACPGKYFADVSMFLAIAMSLAVFSISRPTDGQGRMIKEEYEFSKSGILNHPKKFACEIRPRSKRAVELINATTDEETPDSGHAEKLRQTFWSHDQASDF